MNGAKSEVTVNEVALVPPFTSVTTSVMCAMPLVPASG